jgi:hypothetical protein
MRVSRVSALDVISLIVAAGDCREMQYTESRNRKNVFECGDNYKMMPTYHHIDVFSTDSRACEIPPGKRVVFQSRRLLSEIGDQLMQHSVAYLPYQHLCSSPLGPLLPKMHCKVHKLNDLSHH